MDIEMVFHRLTGDSGPEPIKAGWVERFVVSPLSFWCDIHAPSDSKDPMEPFVQHLFDTGHQHQTEVTEESYPEAVQEIFLTEEGGFRRTLELIYNGERYIKNMPLLARPIGLEGRPDLLERVDGVPSRLGNFSYRVVEIKSAKNIKEPHVLQAAAYNRVLGLVQGYEPDDFDIVNRDLEIQTFSMSNVGTKLDLALAAMREIIAGGEVEPCYGSGKWPWANYVNQMAIQRNDVSLLPGVGETIRRNLMSAGYYTVDYVAAAKESELIAVPRVGPPTARKLVTSAQALVQKRPVRRGPNPQVRRGKTEVFFDFEGTDPRLATDGLEVTNYLIGALWRSVRGTAHYVPFFAATNLDEQANLRSFLEWTHSLDDPVFYHWHHYEKTHVTKMAQFYGLESSVLEWLTNRMVDLSPLVTNSFAFPCYGQGLKDVAKALGFQWRQGDVDGLVSVVLYFRFVASDGKDREAKEKILTYNEDDCLATMHIFDWLLEQRD